MIRFMYSTSEREIVNKHNGACYPIMEYEYGEEYVKVTTIIGDITFSSKEKTGDPTNQDWIIREIEILE